MSLKLEENKLKLLELVDVKGWSVADAASSLGIPQRTCYDFYSKKTFKEWWKEYEKKKFPIKTLLLPIIQPKADQDNINDYLKRLNKQTDDMIANRNLSPFALYAGEVLKPKLTVDSKTKILVIADTQCKPDESLEYMKWIGAYIREKRPDVIVHIGDHFDFPSLSSYDKGKKSFEGRRLIHDIEAGITGLKYLMAEFKSETYKPRLVFCMGNHEDRFNRLGNDIPELDGFVGTETLPLKQMGWEIHEFLKPVEIEGIYFVHYLANPMTGKPFSGTALNQLKTVGKSFVAGHKQCLDMAIRPTIDGKLQIGIINGACYPFDESYKGYQGNNHFRGVLMLHEVNDGFALPMPVSLDYLREKYEN